MHPIVSPYGTAINNTAKFITKILQKYCGKTSSFHKDSTDFIQKIKHLSIKEEEETSVSVDVRALFTSIPLPVSLQVVNSKISTSTSFTNNCKIPTEKFIMFLEFNITNCIFCFNKKFYKKLQDAAMSSPVSPGIANICMEYFESLAIPTSPTLIKWWFRYVDDVHSTTRKDQGNTLQLHISTHKIFHRTPRNRFPFLDTLTKPTPNPIESTIYRKLTHTDRFLECNSNHPISATPSVIHTPIHRAKHLCSTPEFLAKEMEHLHKVLQDNH